jgi:small subunit ribosomal protein S4
MGDPKKQRKKYRRPSHPWEKDRIEAENKLLQKYGLRRKKEVWKTETLLRSFRRNARRLLAASGPQAELETKQMLERLKRLGLISGGATLDDVLGLTVENILERRLQTIVSKKGLAKTPLQARQLVLHGHVMISGKRVTVPSYPVSVKEEGEIGLTPGSNFTQPKPEVPPPAVEAEGPQGSQAEVEGQQAPEQAESKEE